MRKLILLAVLGATSGAPYVARAADAVPKFDVARNCKAETADAAGVGETLASCVKDEEEARSELPRQWDHFTQADKAACIRATSMDGTPSYVELVTCLEIASDNNVRLRGKP